MFSYHFAQNTARTELWEGSFWGWFSPTQRWQDRLFLYFMYLELHWPHAQFTPPWAQNQSHSVWPFLNDCNHNHLEYICNYELKPAAFIWMKTKLTLNSVIDFTSSFSKNCKFGYWNTKLFIFNLNIGNRTQLFSYPNILCLLAGLLLLCAYSLSTTAI